MVFSTNQCLFIILDPLFGFSHPKTFTLGSMMMFEFTLQTIRNPFHIFPFNLFPFLCSQQFIIIQVNLKFDFNLNNMDMKIHMLICLSILTQLGRKKEGGSKACKKYRYKQHKINIQTTIFLLYKLNFWKLCFSRLKGFSDKSYLLKLQE